MCVSKQEVDDVNSAPMVTYGTFQNRTFSQENLFLSSFTCNWKTELHRTFELSCGRI